MAELNESIFRWFFLLSHRSLWFDFAVAFLAKYIVLVLIVLTLIFIFSEKGRRKRMVIFAEITLSVILSRGLISEAILFFYNRPRPFEGTGIAPLISLTGNSFPAGYTAILFAIATSIFYFNNRRGIWFLIFALINGIALITAGVNWPLDILAGAMIGVLSAIVVHSTLNEHRKKIFS